MRITLGVDYGDGPTTVVVTPLAIIGYERANRTKLSKLASDGFGISDMADLAWRQLVIERRYTGTLDEFEGALIDVEVGPSDDPTSPPPVL